MDLDRRELEKRVAEAPDDGRAHLALAGLLAREGLNADAAAACWRASALGGTSEDARDLLASLGAPPSPWSHDSGDAGSSRLAPVRGPRRGEVAVVASNGLGPPRVIDARGGLVGPGPGETVTLRDPRALEVVSQRPLAPGAPGSSGGRPRIAALADGGLVVSTGSHLVALPPGDGAGRVLATRSAREGWFLEPHVDERGRILVATRDGELHRFSAALEPLGPFRCFEPTLPRGAEVSGIAVRAGRVVVLADREEGSHGALLRVLDSDGARLVDGTLTFYRPPGGPVMEYTPPFGRAFGAPLGAPDGRILAVTETTIQETRWRFSEGIVEVDDLALHAVDPSGRVLWTSWLARARSLECRVALAPDGGVLVLADRRLQKLAATGEIEWHVEASGRELVVDREGVVYVSAGEALEARARDGSLVFRVAGELTPLLIDAWGRLLCARGAELVALV